MEIEGLTKKEVKDCILEEIKKIKELQEKMAQKNVIGSWLRGDISYLLKETIYNYEQIIKEILK